MEWKPFSRIVILAAMALLSGETALTQESASTTADVPTGPRVPLQANGPQVSEAAQAAALASERLYVEYDGVKYPLYGWRVGPSNSPERVDATIRQVESVDPGRRVPLGAPGMRSDARFIELNGRAVARPEFLLPAPNEPSDVFHTRLNADEMRLGAASRVLEAVSPGSAAFELEKDILTRIRATTTLGIAHNTGFNATYFDVKTIELGQSQQAGQTRFFGGGNPTGLKLSELESLPVSFLLDNQIMNVGGPGGSESQLQLYLEANNAADPGQLDTPHLFARIWDKDLITITAGRTYSLFSNRGLTPTQLQGGGALIGSSSGPATTIPQFRIQRACDAQGGWGGGFGIEDSSTVDTLILPVGVTRLTRWPGFAGNLIYQGANPENFIQFGATQKTIGCQLADGVEQFESSFGLGAYSQWIVTSQGDNRGALFMGVSGGDGIGNHINGVALSGVFAGGQLVKLEGLGTYLGYGHAVTDARGWKYAANCVYGYATLETPQYLLDPAKPVNADLHQAWVNFMVSPSPQIAAGIEWQYGRREIQTGIWGEDNQFMFVLALTTKPGKTTAPYTTRADGSVESALNANELGVRSSGQAYRQAL